MKKLLAAIMVISCGLIFFCVTVPVMLCIAAFFLAHKIGVLVTLLVAACIMYCIKDEC